MVIKRGRTTIWRQLARRIISLTWRTPTCRRGTENDQLRQRRGAINELINLQSKKSSGRGPPARLKAALDSRHILLSQQTEILKRSEISYLTQDLTAAGQRQRGGPPGFLSADDAKRSLAHMQRAIAYQPSSFMKLIIIPRRTSN